ncbi:hypothetical protein [Tenacibaculum sp. 190524A05c]|uniref:Aromatic ring-opening dioxygenase LigA n=1 Tax=Tenacibaculum platacis TaxID=3137852 RepID=A0ABP1EFB4_9FLAO
MDIKLNFINKSQDTNNSSVVIFQQNVATNFDEIAVAWKVIKNCGRLDNHPFKYPLNFEVSAADSYGNHTPQLTAQYGDLFEMVKDASGDILQLSSKPASSPNQTELDNNLTEGAIDANCYRDGKLCATTTSIVPGQKAAFEFQPKIYIGVASNIDEGEIINSAIVSQINTEINLEGITSADIVMTGGGSGAHATPFKFSLENINQ